MHIQRLLVILYPCILLYNIAIVKSIVVLYNIKKEVFIMAKNITFSLDEKLIAELKKVSEETMIPQAKIVKMGIELALQKIKKPGV